MKKETAIIITNALIWAIVLIASSLTLRGTGAYAKIQLILGGGAAASLLVVGAGLRIRRPK